MDTRLSVMLPEALGIKNGEVKMVKVAGGVILGDYDAPSEESPACTRQYHRPWLHHRLHYWQAD